ncbi:hypothetical protein Pelo_4537 [Pelomyxa schiedti]|nr:hypothetical protein Pelo_4537 [Pelomyxa schiedti]
MSWQQVPTATATSVAPNNDGIMGCVVRLSAHAQASSLCAAVVLPRCGSSSPAQCLTLPLLRRICRLVVPVDEEHASCASSTCGSTKVAKEKHKKRLMTRRMFVVVMELTEDDMVLGTMVTVRLSEASGGVCERPKCTAIMGGKEWPANYYGSCSYGGPWGVRVVGSLDEEGRGDVVMVLNRIMDSVQDPTRFCNTISLHRENLGKGNDGVNWIYEWRGWYSVVAGCSSRWAVAVETPDRGRQVILIWKVIKTVPEKPAVMIELDRVISATAFQFSQSFYSSQSSSPTIDLAILHPDGTTLELKIVDLASSFQQRSLVFERTVTWPLPRLQCPTLYYGAVCWSHTGSAFIALKNWQQNDPTTITSTTNTNTVLCLGTGATVTTTPIPGILSKVGCSQFLVESGSHHTFVDVNTPSSPQQEFNAGAILPPNTRAMFHFCDGFALHCHGNNKSQITIIDTSTSKPLVTITRPRHMKYPSVRAYFTSPTVFPESDPWFAAAQGL